MRGDGCSKRRALLGFLFSCEKNRRFVEPAADKQAKRADNEAEQERYAPAPTVERIGRKRSR